MNILFFLTPKSDVAFLYDDETLRQALENTLEPLQRVICCGELRTSMI